MKLRHRSLLAPLSGTALFAFAACSNGGASASGPTSPTPDGGLDSGIHGSASAPALPCTDTIASVYGDPGPLPANKGAIIRCAYDREMSASDIQTFVVANGYTGAPMSSGGKIYHVSFRTERGDTAASPGFSSALMVIPDIPRATALPAVVSSHGTGGQAPNCVGSMNSLSGKNDSYAAQFLGLAGSGFAVLVPDYAGFANYGAAGNSPSGYLSTGDEGKSVLDGARALATLLPNLVTSNVVITGHSQGGHAALSALALWPTYGQGLNLQGVVAYSPVWFSQASWGGMISLSDDFPLNDADSLTIAAGAWYHYSHGELLDGPGHGGDVFADAGAVKQWFDTSCDGNPLEALGNYVADLYTPALVNSVAFAAAVGSSCNGDPVCETWTARYAADRPHMLGASLNVPILLAYGSADTTVPPDRAVCGFDRLHSDNANLTVCVYAGVSHTGVVSAASGYVNDWVAHVALGAADPGSCGPDQAALTYDDGGVIGCATPPPN